jgi:hypothetical protein
MSATQLLEVGWAYHFKIALLNVLRYFFCFCGLIHLFCFSLLRSPSFGFVKSVKWAKYGQNDSG